MIEYVKLEEVIKKQGKQLGYMLLCEEQGCVNGCCCGVSIYTDKEYGQAAAHDDQEGFYVLEGKGFALIGEQEIMLEPGISFLVPPHTEHVMKAAENTKSCKLFWFHAAV